MENQPLGMRRHLCTLLPAVLLPLMPCAVLAGPSDIAGLWLDGEGKGAVNIAHCGAHLCGRLEHFCVSLNRRNALDPCFVAFSSREPVSTSLENALVWLKEPLGNDGKPKIDRHNDDETLRKRPLCAMALLGDFQDQGGGAWADGWIYNPKDGGTYNATLTLAADGTLTVRGYGGISLFGTVETWTRATTAMPSCQG